MLNSKSRIFAIYVYCFVIYITISTSTSVCPYVSGGVGVGVLLHFQFLLSYHKIPLVKVTLACVKSKEICILGCLGSMRLEETELHTLHYYVY